MAVLFPFSHYLQSIVHIAVFSHTTMCTCTFVFPNLLEPGPETMEGLLFRAVLCSSSFASLSPNCLCGILESQKAAAATTGIRTCKPLHKRHHSLCLSEIHRSLALCRNSPQHRSLPKLTAASLTAVSLSAESHCSLALCLKHYLQFQLLLDRCHTNLVGYNHVR